MADKEIKFVLSAQDRTASAIDGLRSRMGGLQGNVDGLNSGFAKLGVVFGSAFAGLTLTAFIKGTANGIDKLNDLKDATGASIGNLSALEDVAARTGSSFEVVGQALTKFNKDLNEADKGSETANILKQLGLDAEKLRQIDPAEALRQTAAALARFADDGNKARIVQSLFGKSVQEVAPFLKDLADKTQLVGTVTEQQALQAEKFVNQLHELEKNSTDLARSLTSQLVPALNNVLQSYLKLGGVKGVALALLGLDEQGETKSKVADLQGQINRTADAIGRMTEELERPGADKELLGGRIDKARAKLAGLLKDAGAASEKLKQLADGTDGGAGAKPDYGNEGRNRPRPSLPGKIAADKKAEKEAIDDARQALAAYVAQQGKELEKNQQLTEEQKALNLLKTLGTLGQVPQVRELVLGLAAQNDELENQAVLKRLNIDVDKERERQQKQVDDFASGGGSTAAKVRAETEALTMNAAQIRRRTELDRLDQEVQRASIGVTGERRDQILALAEAMREDLVRAIDAAEERQNALNASFSGGATKALDAYVESADNKSKQAEDFVTRGINNMEDALVQFATTGKTSFRSLANSIISDLLRIQARAAISGILKYINAGSSAYNYSGDTSGSLFSATGADIAGRRAMGGPVSAGSTYLVGEQGPELLTLGGTGGNVTPNSALGKSPGTVFDFSGQTINVGQGASRAEVYAAVQQGNAQTEKRIRRLIAQGSFA